MARALLPLALALALCAGAAPPAETLTPALVAERLQARFERLADYECVMRTETRAAGKVEAGTFRFWYRKPGLLRLRVLKGRRKGSELVLGADGVLRGRKGGLLKPFSRRLSRSDSSLRSLRGQPAWELDFGSFLRAMRERLALPGSSASLKAGSPQEPLITLEVLYRPPGSSTRLRDVWVVDPREWLLVSGDVFDGETRVDHIQFAEIRPDRGLSEDWFRF
jgi:hypothetical protein